MLLIFTHQVTPRIQFIFDLILKDLCGINFQLTFDEDNFNLYNGPKLCYTRNKINASLFIKSTGLLFETGIKPQNIEAIKWKDLTTFYPTSADSVLPFDVFAASFYLVSRYEEYLPYAPDEYGRFNAKCSFAYRNNFLSKPMVNLYALELKKILKENFPQLDVKENIFEFISTLDIDNAYAYRGKGVYRTSGAIMRSLLKFDFHDLKLRIGSIVNWLPDPYDTYAYYFKLQDELQFKSIFFFLIGDFAMHDKNLPYNSKLYNLLIKSIAFKNESGIHPSYSSNDKKDRMQKEIHRLKQITGKEVTKSRQHFLKMQLPGTYNQLLNLGITDDYTMGYADAAGFRASICFPYFFFDLKKNECTNLRIHPFAVMDATLNNYMKLTTEDAIICTGKLIDEVKKVNGTFISLWHNETLSEKGIWKNWRRVFEYTVKYASSL